MNTCVILHNMIVEDERDLDLLPIHDNAGSRMKPSRNPDKIETFLGTSSNFNTISWSVSGNCMGDPSPPIYLVFSCVLNYFFPFQAIY